MAENLNKQLSKLSKRGPHRVHVGDLDYAGIPGKVYAPAEGQGLPAVAFGHDWMKDISSYEGTLRHLASWGIVVAAPNTEKGIAPDHRGFAADLETTLQILAGVRLGTGNVTVAPRRLGLVGHGMGASAAILAAVGRPSLTAVAALYPSQTAPSPVVAASQLTMPGLVIGSNESPFLDFGNAPKIAQSWGGSCTYFEVDNANHLTLSEDTMFKLLTGLGGLRAAPRETVRGVLTGYLLHQFEGGRHYAGFSSPHAEAKKLRSYTPQELEQRANGANLAAGPMPFVS